MKEGQQGTWAGGGDFPRAYWEDSEVKLGFLWNRTPSLVWREKDLGWRARASVD